MVEEPGTFERILEVGRHIMQSRGYNELRYADVADAVGIRRASVHHYFPTKLQLGVAVIARYRERLVEKLTVIDAQTDDPREKLDRYVDLYRAVLSEDEEHMCPGGMLAAEVVSLPAELQREVVEFFADNESWLVRVLSIVQGDERWSGSVEATARHVVAVLQGALLMARLYGDPERLTATAAELRDALWAELPAAAVSNVLPSRPD